MGSSVQSFVDSDLRLARFPGANDADGVTADFRVDHEEDAARRGLADEDEAVFVRWSFVAEVDALRIFEAGRGFFETDAMFPTILSRFLRIPGEAHAFSVTRKFATCQPFRPAEPHLARLIGDRSLHHVQDVGHGTICGRGGHQARRGPVQIERDAEDDAHEHGHEDPPGP